MNFKRTFLKLAACAALAATALHAAAAEDYPRKPIHMLVPFAAGAATDVVARSLAKELGEKLGQPVVVENRLGAGGNIAYDAVAKSAPDGYTLIFASTGIATNATLYKNLPYDVRKDLTPVAEVARSSHILVVRPGLHVHTVPELIALARKRPEGLNCGHSGVGTILHLACEMFKTKAGAPMRSIPYRGGTLAMQDLIGGNIDLMFVDISVGLPQIKAGNAIALGTTGARRSPTLPDLPTVAEAGVPDFAIEAWFGVLAPAGTPAPIVNRLSREIDAIVKAPEFKQRMLNIGQEVVGSTPQEFGAFLDSEIRKMGEIVRTSGATAN